MFARFIRPLWGKFFTPRAFFTTSAILAYTLIKPSLLLDSFPNEAQPNEQSEAMEKNVEEYIKKLKYIDVCESKELLENHRKAIIVKDHLGRQRKIIIMRSRGKLHAFLGSCPYEEPFEDIDVDYSLEGAMVFNDKLYCPHHGCIFDIKSGSVEHGPVMVNLSIFLPEEKDGKIKLIYPQALPTSVSPLMAERDVEDHRKVMVLGGDDAATIGCINGLRQFGYQGEITVVKQGPYTYPYKKEYLHKSLLNLHLHDSSKIPSQSSPKTTTLEAAQNSSKPVTKQTPIKQADVNKLIQKELQQKIYRKLRYYGDDWYQHYGVDFVFNDQAYRIINKQYYPYVTFADGSRMQYDTLLVATGLVQKLPTLEGITTNAERDLNINLPENVFCPLRSKQQHTKLNTFLNANIIKSLLVMGYNLESLEFIEALKHSFPEIKVTVIDSQRDSAISEVLGPQLEKNISKEFTSRGVDFFIKIRSELFFSNYYSHKNIKKRQIQSKTNQNTGKTNTKDPRLRYQDAVTVQIAQNLRVKADGVVIFPHQFAGNTQWVRNGKYTDFEYLHEDRLAADTFCRTDNIRIFSAGLSSTNEYYLLTKRLVSTDPAIAYELGFNSAINMQALRVPFTYVPYERFEFFGKKLFYTGTRDFYDTVLVMGSVEEWDFLTIYALGNQVKAVSASPSRTKQMAIIRQALRLNCVPSFEDLLSGYWSIQNLTRLIRDLNKSGCYRDIIFANRENIHKKDLVWMERTPDAGFENDRPQNSQQYPSVQVAADGKLKQL